VGVEAGAAVVVGAGVALSVLQAGKSDRTDQTKSFFDEIMMIFSFVRPPARRVRPEPNAQYIGA
jgi:hypothetical protein